MIGTAQFCVMHSCSQANTAHTTAQRSREKHKFAHAMIPNSSELDEVAPYKFDQHDNGDLKLRG